MAIAAITQNESPRLRPEPDVILRAAAKRPEGPNEGSHCHNSKAVNGTT